MSMRYALVGRYKSPDGRVCNLYQDSGGVFYFFRMKKRHISNFNDWCKVAS